LILRGFFARRNAQLIRAASCLENAPLNCMPVACANQCMQWADVQSSLIIIEKPRNYGPPQAPNDFPFATSVNCAKNRQQLAILSEFFAKGISSFCDLVCAFYDAAKFR
ncbi:MAG: hypothetical protein RSC06_16260, partial [Clostridia bacterium]